MQSETDAGSDISHDFWLADILRVCKDYLERSVSLLGCFYNYEIYKLRGPLNFMFIPIEKNG
jgi:hypothetical protein